MKELEPLATFKDLDGNVILMDDKKKLPLTAADIVVMSSLGVPAMPLMPEKAQERYQLAKVASKAKKDKTTFVVTDDCQKWLAEQVCRTFGPIIAGQWPDFVEKAKTVTQPDDVAGNA